MARTAARWSNPRGGRQSPRFTPRHPRASHHCRQPPPTALRVPPRRDPDQAGMGRQSHLIHMPRVKGVSKGCWRHRGLPHRSHGAGLGQRRPAPVRGRSVRICDALHAGLSAACRSVRQCAVASHSVPETTRRASAGARADSRSDGGNGYGPGPPSDLPRRRASPAGAPAGAGGPPRRTAGAVAGADGEGGSGVRALIAVVPTERTTDRCTWRAALVTYGT